MEFVGVGGDGRVAFGGSASNMAKSGAAVVERRLRARSKARSKNDSISTRNSTHFVLNVIHWNIVVTVEHLVLAVVGKFCLFALQLKHYFF